MTTDQNHPEISRLRRRYTWQRLVETALISVSAGLVTYASASFLAVSPEVNGVLSIALLFLTFLFQTIRLEIGRAHV
jgi:hypothetical protein